MKSRQDAIEDVITHLVDGNHEMQLILTGDQSGSVAPIDQMSTDQRVALVSAIEATRSAIKIMEAAFPDQRSYFLPPTVVTRTPGGKSNG